MEEKKMQETAMQNENQEAANEQQVNEQQNKEIEFFPEMLEEMTDEERSNFFEEYGKGVMNRYFDRALTEKEENEMKNDLYELNLDLMAKKEEKADIVKSMGDQIKSLETQMGEVTNNIKKGTKEVYEPCVKVLDMKNHKVYFFAQNDGRCVFQRNITGDDLEQSFPFETVYNVTDDNGGKAELIVSRHGGFPEESDETSNEDGTYTMDEGSVIVVMDGKITSIDRRSSTKYEPKIGENFKYEGEHKLPTGYTIFVTNGVINEVYEPGTSRPDKSESEGEQEIFNTEEECSQTE